MEILKVSAKSNPNSVAGALAGVIRETGSAEMHCTRLRGTARRRPHLHSCFYGHRD